MRTNVPEFSTEEMCVTLAQVRYFGSLIPLSGSSAKMVERSMIEKTMPTAYASPRIDALLAHVSDTPKVATALLDALANHVERKTSSLKKRANAFESKWHMSFDEFSVRVKAGRVAKAASHYDAQHDLTNWEQTLSLLKHYQSLKVR